MKNSTLSYQLLSSLNPIHIHASWNIYSWNTYSWNNRLSLASYSTRELDNFYANWWPKWWPNSRFFLHLQSLQLTFPRSTMYTPEDRQDQGIRKIPEKKGN